MNICINTETMYHEMLMLLDNIFNLPEINKVLVYGIDIFSAEQKSDIKDAVNLCYHDILSDIDMEIHVTLNPEDCRNNNEYITNPERIGLIRDNYLGLAVGGDSNFQMLRLILKSGIRFDIGFYIKKDSKSPVLNISMPVQEAVKDEGNYWPHWDLRRADSFWFTEIHALAKLYRGDYLIAEHLANMQINETAAAQMVIRDNMHSTNVHRYGYHEKLDYRMVNLDEYPLTKRSEEFMQIAYKIYAAACSYDRLVKSLNPFYDERKDILFDIWRQYDNQIKYLN